MECPNCHHIVPEDSEFCQYCGETIPHNDHSFKQTESLKDDGSSIIEPKLTLNNDQEKLKKKSKLLTTVLIVVAAVAVILAGLNVYQLIGNANNNQLINDYENQIKKKDKQINEKDDQIKSIQGELKEANKKVYNYDTLVSALESPNNGYATNYFCVNQGVVVLGLGESKTLTLTAAFGAHATIYTSSDYDYVADVKFNESSWEGDYTTITVKAGIYARGIGRITFTNSVDSSSFQIIVIVK